MTFLIRIVVVLLVLILGYKVYTDVVYPRIRYKEVLDSLESYGEDDPLAGLDFSIKKREGFIKRVGGNIYDKIVSEIYMLVPLNDDYQYDLGARLRSAGIEEDPRYFLASSLVTTVLFMATGFVVGRLLSVGVLEVIQYVIVGMLAGILKARMRIQRGVKARKWMIRRQLPDVLDIISASVAAGLAFDQSLIYVVERGRGPLVHEFDIVMREMSLGRPRREALEAMSKRCDVDEVTTLVGAINQASSYGIPMQNVLLTQAKIIRENRKMEAEETAAKMPIKMLFPMVFFIFPVIFIIILYPIIPSILESLSGAL